MAAADTVTPFATGSLSAPPQRHGSVPDQQRTSPPHDRGPRLSVLVDQQLWFVGQDIQHADGNALLRFGAHRVRSVFGVGTSYYVLPLDDEHDAQPWRSGESASLALVCWGFAVYLGPVLDGAVVCEPSCDRASLETSGVLVRRLSSMARLLNGPLQLPIHVPRDLPAGRVPNEPAAVQLYRLRLQTMSSAFCAYETWVAEHLGAPYRRRVLSSLPRHKQRRFSLETDLTDCWTRFGAALCTDPPAADIR